MDLYIHTTPVESASSLHNSRDKMTVGRRKKTSLKKKKMKQILESKDVYTEALGQWGRQPGLDIQPGVCRSSSMFLRNMAADFLADTLLDQLPWLFEQATQTERDNGGTCEAIRPDWLVGLNPYRSQSMEHPFKYSQQTALCEHVWKRGCVWGGVYVQNIKAKVRELVGRGG